MTKFVTPAILGYNYVIKKPIMSSYNTMYERWDLADTKGYSIVVSHPAPDYLGDNTWKYG